VDELELFLHPGRDTTTVGAIQVTNTTDHEVQVLVELGDWERDLQGRNIFMAAGQSRNSCGQRLHAFPMGFRLGAHESAPLRVSYAGPARPGCWGIVFVQTDDRPAALKQSGLLFKLRTGVKVYVEAPDARKDGAVTGLEVVDTVAAARPGEAAARRRSARITFRNTGEAHLRVKGSLEIRRNDGSGAGAVDLGEVPIAPGAERRIDAVLPALPAGKYVLLALLDFGGDEIAAGQAELEVQ
ncbi:MAG TPA: hypothetical protein VF832_12450, partial [Longimicrobiales bacterium]